jgi:putative transposase
MQEDSVVRLPRPGVGIADDPLLTVLREGARRMLTQAIEAEVEGFIAGCAGLVDEQGRRRVVRNGHGPERTLQTGIGPIAVRRPKVRDRGASHSARIRFTSAVLPAYLRRTKNVEDLLPWLYLKGISTGQFEEALAALLGADAPGLSATTVRRLTEAWQDEHEHWQMRDLSVRRYVYLWADGVYFTPRLEHDRQCILVLIGADASGRKELLAIEDGFRESAQSWREVLLRLRDENGLVLDPELATGDGALGFWQALHEVWPKTKQQRCWVHKYGAKYGKAVHCLSRDREALLTFYDVPAEHWTHVRTTNPIESTFATVRLRTAKTKGCLSRRTALAMVFKLVKAAERHWRQLNGAARLAQVIQGIRFRDGEPVQETEEQAAA